MASEGKDYRPLWFGAIGALLAALFGFAGNLVLHYITANSPALSYSVTEGPSLPTSDGFKQICVVEAQNSGRAELTNLVVRITVDRGKLEQGSWRASDGVTGQDTLANNTYQVSVPLLNPGEHVSLATIMTLVENYTHPDVAVRAVGITGTRSDSSSPQSRTQSVLAVVLSAIFAGLSLTLLGVLVRRNLAFRNAILSIAGFSIQRIKPVTPRESLTYILHACEIAKEAERIQFSEYPITYMEFADRLLVRALPLPTEERHREILALKCMLLIPVMAEASRENVKRALRILAQPNEVEAKRIEDRRSATNWRDEVDRLVAENAAERTGAIKVAS